MSFFAPHGTVNPKLPEIAQVLIQAGFIDSVGVDLYLDLIHEEINNTIDETQDTINIDDVETHILEDYSRDDDVIIELHQKINSIKNNEELKKLEYEIKDRFGKLDENIKDYMYQEYLEKLLNDLGIEIASNDNQKITLKLTEKIYKNLNIEELFINTLQISTKFNFIYRNTYIALSIQKSHTDKKYIYYLVKVIEYIKKEIKSSD